MSGLKLVLCGAMVLVLFRVEHSSALSCREFLEEKKRHLKRSRVIAGRWVRQRFNRDTLKSAVIEEDGRETSPPKVIKVIHVPHWWASSMMLQVDDEVFIGNIVWLKKDFDQILAKDALRGKGRWEVTMDFDKDQSKAMMEFLEDRKGINRLTPLCHGSLTCSEGVSDALAAGMGFKARLGPSTFPGHYLAYLKTLEMLEDKSVGKIEYVGPEKNFPVLRTIINGETVWLTPAIAFSIYKGATALFGKDDEDSEESIDRD